MEKESKKKISNKKAIFSILIIFFLLLILATVVIYIIKNSNTDKTNKQNNNIEKQINKEDHISKETITFKEITSDDEREIIKILNISEEDFYEFKNSFIQCNGMWKNNSISTDEIEEEAKKEFNKLENYILLNNNDLSNYFMEYYSPIYSYAISGIINTTFNYNNFSISISDETPKFYSFNINNEYTVYIYIDSTGIDVDICEEKLQTLKEIGIKNCQRYNKS